MEKDRIDSIGSKSKIVKRWSGAKLAIGDPLLKLLVLAVVLVSAMEKVACFCFVGTIVLNYMAMVSGG